MSPLKLITLSLLLASVSAQYKLIREYSGQSFFERWSFDDSANLTNNGDVFFVTQDIANSSNLVNINSAQNAIIKVDNATTVPQNDKRNSVKITSTDSYSVGTVWIVDVVHLPWGPNWPNNGEIDIVEGVNKNLQNQMAIHTRNGCSMITGKNQLGTPGATTNCTEAAGCTVLDTTNKTSYGPSFNKAGGGVWAAQFDISGIYIWFWDRSTVPDPLKRSSTADTLDLSSWGPPVASYPSSNSCNISDFFRDQQIVIDITLCGDWAGLPGVYPQTCADQPSNTPNPAPPPPGYSNCYPYNVVGPGSPLYDEAWFEISHIRAYSVLNTNTSSATDGTASNNTISAGGNPTATTSSHGSSSNSAVSFLMKPLQLVGISASLICSLML